MDAKQKDLLLKGAAAALVLAFFLTWNKILDATALNLVFDSRYQADFIDKILLLLPALTGAGILYYVFQKKGQYPLDQKLLYSIPAAAMVVLYFITNSRLDKLRRLGGQISMTDVLGAGFWIAAVGALALLYLAFGDQIKKNIDKNKTADTHRP